MNDYKPNSHKYHAEKKEETAIAEKRATKVVNGTVSTKKKSDFATFAKNFIAEDASNVGRYIWEDLVVPTVKKTIVNVVTDAARIIFLGKNAQSSNGSSPGSPKVSYRSYYDDPKTVSAPKAANRFDFETITFETRGQAEAVRVELNNIMSRYRCVRVADLFEAAGLVPNTQAYKYGWTDISGARVDYWDGKYIIKMPSALPLD
jgi:hypothetical protein